MRVDFFIGNIWSLGCILTMALKWHLWLYGGCVNLPNINLTYAKSFIFTFNTEFCIRSRLTLGCSCWIHFFCSLCFGRSSIRLFIVRHSQYLLRESHLIMSFCVVQSLTLKMTVMPILLLAGCCYFVLGCGSTWDSTAGLKTLSMIFFVVVVVVVG